MKRSRCSSPLSQGRERDRESDDTLKRTFSFLWAVVEILLAVVVSRCYLTVIEEESTLQLSFGQKVSRNFLGPIVFRKHPQGRNIERAAN